jgi:hypothetical protein
MCSNSQGYYGSNNNTPEDVIEDSQSILERIAMISHGGGLIGFADESSALNEIRRLSQPFVGNQVNRAQFLSAPIDNRGYIDLRQVREKSLPTLAPTPISVNDRLPGPEDCDNEGRCWWGESYYKRWTLYPVWAGRVSYKQWLPYYAIQIPTYTETGKVK